MYNQLAALIISLERTIFIGRTRAQEERLLDKCGAVPKKIKATADVLQKMLMDLKNGIIEISKGVLKRS